MQLLIKKAMVPVARSPTAADLTFFYTYGTKWDALRVQAIAAIELDALSELAANLGSRAAV